MEEDNNNDQYDYSLKIILVGDVAVGKTNLITRYTTKSFSIESKPTLGIGFSTASLYKDGKVIRIQIWDTSGQEIYKSMTKSYFKGAHGAIVVYDITKHKTFESVTTWLKDINEVSDINPVIMIIGNKCDLTNLREVPQEEAIQFAKEHSVGFIETSALNMVHVDVAFENIINGMNLYITIEIYKQIKKKPNEPQNERRIEKGQAIGLKPENKAQPSMSTCPC